VTGSAAPLLRGQSGKRAAASVQWRRREGGDTQEGEGLEMMKAALPSLVAALFALSACSSSQPSQVTTTTTTLPPCTQTVLFQGSGSVPPSFLDAEPFTVTTAGRLDVILDWTFASSPVGAYVVPAGQCNLTQFNNRSCTFILQSEPGGKPKKVSVPSIAPGNYNLLIGNFASQDESVTTQVILSSTTCPPLALALPRADAAGTPALGGLGEGRLR
jgi:hypothetical protein